MEQHPIPQQISSYQFKLVGDMTLKQFFQLAGGVVVGLLFYSTPLHPIIKWPIIIFSVLIGVALAFLPFEERPLEKWIVAFFRSIYSPTLYTWKKSDKPQVFFAEDKQAPVIQNVPNSTTVETNSVKLEEAEKSFLSKIGALWSIPAAKTNTNPANSTSQQNPAPLPQPTAPLPTVSLEKEGAASSLSLPVVSKQAAEPVAVPQQIPTVITRSAPKLIVEEAVRTENKQPLLTSLPEEKVENKSINASEVEFSIDAAPPNPPTIINTVVGQVMDQDRKIIEGSILEIRDSNGRPVRALKSNKAGHFIIVTPLANGKYVITIEKEGFKFDPISFEATGEIIPPIAIKGNKI